MDAWIDGWVEAWMDRWLTTLMYGYTDERVHERMRRWMDGGTNVGMHGQMETDRRMDDWIGLDR